MEFLALFDRFVQIVVEVRHHTITKYIQSFPLAGNRVNTWNLYKSVNTITRVSFLFHSAHMSITEAIPDKLE